MSRDHTGHKSKHRPQWKSRKSNNVEPLQPVLKKFRHKEGDGPFQGPAPVPLYKVNKYKRGKYLQMSGIKTRVKRKQLVAASKKVKVSETQAARTELLLPEESGFLEAEENEDTCRIHQEKIAAAVDITSTTKFFNLNLHQFGPYRINYTQNGRSLLLGGHMGHVAALDWVTKNLTCEINVMESVHDIKWLHIPTMFAVSQKNWVYIYDNQGIELHCIKKLYHVQKMEFLRYHFLLACASETSYLSWLDVSVGRMVAQFYTKSGNLDVLCQNPYNAILVAGHPNGTITMWSPNIQEPLVKMLCHTQPVRSISVDSRGMYLVTGSADRVVKVWDIRNYKCLQSYRVGGPPVQLTFSQRGLLGVAVDSTVEIYKDCCVSTATKPYLRHKAPAPVTSLEFCPYEDVLGIGHNKGFTSILVPGAGEPNFDAYESNPYMTKSQRREMEVKALLEKVSPELICLNPGKIGEVDIPTLQDKIENKKKLLYVKPLDIELELQKKNKRKTNPSKIQKRIVDVKEQGKRKLLQETIKKKQEKTELVKRKENVLDRFRSKH
ncbi:WD repeat-containing protein 46 isoform X2 [Tachypleus tridentatus]